jgi:tungstate transport system substrate-binding protein
MMPVMGRSAFVVVLLALLSVLPAGADEKCDAVYGSGGNAFSLATGSPGELGMLKVVAESFARSADARMCWVKAGSGDSLKLLKNRKVDMIMVHAPAAEKQAIADGWATRRLLLGSNEFYIVGPASDPAGIKQAKTAPEAYQKIAASKALFFSRGDNSGTHKKELAIWKKAGIAPSGKWYVVYKGFMTAVLKRANDENGYFMTDSSTWAAERKNVPSLSILFRGDRMLVNTYHSLVQPAQATAGAATAAKFADFVVSETGQRLIREFGREQHGEGLYSDAAYAKQYDE